MVGYYRNQCSRSGGMGRKEPSEGISVFTELLMREEGIWKALQVTQNGILRKLTEMLNV